MIVLLSLVASCVSPQKEMLKRSPSSFGDLNSPCRDSRDCAGLLICKSGWCRNSDPKREAFEFCRLAQECASGRCEGSRCIPSFASPADNDQECFGGVPTNCRSQKTFMGMCQASSFFPGLPGKTCSAPTDCISRRCGQANRCLAGSDSLSCAWVGESCGSDSECCSKTCLNNRCVGKGRQSCLNGSCPELVGRVCAAGRQQVQYDSECCSLRKSGMFCVEGSGSSPVFCLESRDCPNGLVCDPKRKFCVP